MSSINYDTESLFCLSIAGSNISSCYSEDSQPRICFDEYCTFPLGPMCQACALDRAVRKKRISKTARVQQAKEWVEEINVQKYITNYSGEVFLGGALDRDAELEGMDLDSDENEGQYYQSDAEYQYHGSDEEDHSYVSEEDDQHYESDEEDGPDQSIILIPESFTSDWETNPSPPSAAAKTSPSPVVSSRDSVRSDFSAYLEPWMSDLFDRTLEGQMEETIFLGGAEDDPSQVICPLCRKILGDPTYQHLLRCQFAHDEQERMEVLWRR